MLEFLSPDWCQRASCVQLLYAMHTCPAAEMLGIQIHVAVSSNLRTSHLQVESDLEAACFSLMWLERNIHRVHRSVDKGALLSWLFFMMTGVFPVPKMTKSQCLQSWMCLSWQISTGSWIPGHYTRLSLPVLEFSGDFSENIGHFFQAVFSEVSPRHSEYMTLLEQYPFSFPLTVKYNFELNSQFWTSFSTFLLGVLCLFCGFISSVPQTHLSSSHLPWSSRIPALHLHSQTDLSYRELLIRICFQI